MFSAKSSPKIGDRPHWITISISLTAIVFSLISLWVSYDTKRITTATSRAAVQVTSAKLIERPEVATFLRAELVLSNFGKAKAKDVLTYLDYEVTSFPGAVRDATSGNVAYKAVDMAPAFSQTIRLEAGRMLARHRAEFSKPRTKLIVFGLTEYTDEVTGVRLRESWCFLYDPKDEKQANSLELRRCVY